jgi:hypothetical protein
VTPAELLVQLCERVWRPLIAGGELRPLPPIGRGQAQAALGYVHALAAPSLDEIRLRRLLVARRLSPVDGLGEPGPGEWLLLMALNDLLQATNPTLDGVFGADRPRRLVAEAEELVNRAGAPTTVHDALSRHTTFARLLDLTRVDTHVSWWVGKKTFRGALPAKRLLRWKSIRRVNAMEQRVELTQMAPVEATWAEAFGDVLESFLAATPLTDLATADRDAPPFTWTGSSLALIATDAGRHLAARAVSRSRRRKQAIQAIQKIPRSVQKSEAPEAIRVHGAVAELLAATGG